MRTILNPSILILLCQFSIIISCSDCNTGYYDTTKEIENVKASINGTIAWAKEKDFDLLYSIIARDSNYLEVSPGKRITRGFDQFRENESFWGSSDFKAIRYEIRDLVINFSANSDVAWFFCMLDDINEWKGEPASWVNTRWTGVLEKRNNEWQMVQMHFSFAAEK